MLLTNGQTHVYRGKGEPDCTSKAKDDAEAVYCLQEQKSAVHDDWSVRLSLAERMIGRPSTEQGMSKSAASSVTILVAAAWYCRGSMPSQIASCRHGGS